MTNTLTRRQRLGRFGEDLAVRHLENSGFVVLERNWRSRSGELDIVATDRTMLLVCEVKTRAGASTGPPEGAVTDEKAYRIRRLAHEWLAEHRMDWTPIRYDVIAVHAPRGGQPRLKHIEGAF
ncbi:YraN family protein [Amycolatopsis sp. cg5]|uniref:YraN family protein n=1 Tax=Amycolatopsis sp. cg5 TaxID=3238802 RepID=UPI0035254A97